MFLEDDDEPVDLSTSWMKCVSGQWLVQLYKYLEDNPQIVVHGFRHAGIYDALGLLDEDDLPDYTTIDESDIDEVIESPSSKFLVSDVYMDSQTEEETEAKDTGIDDVVTISDSDSDL